MSCGKKPLVKRWDKLKVLEKISQSKYEQNEASVKLHWKKVIQDLEDSYKDDQFWETQANLVHELVGPMVFQRIAKIFSLQQKSTYEPKSEDSSIIPSDEYFEAVGASEGDRVSSWMSDIELEKDELTGEESIKSIASTAPSADDKGSEKSHKLSKSANLLKSDAILSKMPTWKSSSSSKKSLSDSISFDHMSSLDEPASDDDVLVQHSKVFKKKKTYSKHSKNPHFQMLYCNESETDMIKWKSKYKHKIFEVSASDEFSKKAEIMTKKIAKEFYDWWVDLGTVEFKSEIRRPEDIEDLFQVWFDESASRSLKLDPKIMPCVLESIAKYVGVPQLACPAVLNRQIAFDIYAETSPEHTKAFNTCLPQRMKHIPPKNNTKEMWECLKIPEDLKTMSCVWQGIEHLTSTKSFQIWLQDRPNMKMPPVLRKQKGESKTKKRFAIPSDFILRGKMSDDDEEDDGNMALPISNFSMELTEIIDKLMND